MSKSKSNELECPRVERLELRRLLAAAIEGGTLVATGSDGRDTIELRRTGSDDVIVTLWQGSSTPVSRQVFDMDDFDGVLLNGRGGNDRIYYAGDRVVPDVTMSGGAGADWLYGAFASNAAEFLIGGDGDDTITGNGGPDTVSAGAGNDTVQLDGIFPTAEFDYGVWGIPLPPAGVTADQIVLADDRGFDRYLAPAAAPSISAVGETLAITGAPDDDFFVINEHFALADEDLITSVMFDGSYLEFDALQFTTMRVLGTGGSDTVVLGAALRETEQPVAHFIVEGHGGDDYFHVDETIASHDFFGGEGNDVAESAVSHEITPNLSGGPGIDTIVANGPIDLRDRLDVENARAFFGPVYGNALNNHLTVMNGGAIFAGAGKDTLFAGESDGAELFGEGGDDLIIVGAFANLIDGGAGIDTLQDGGSRIVNDVRSIERFDPPEVLLAGNLEVFGTVGNDVIELRRVGIDDVRIRIWVNGAASTSLDQTVDLDDFVQLHVHGAAGNDNIYVADGAAIANLVLKGGFGADTLLGSSLGDTMFGGAESDRLFGIAGNDVFDSGDQTFSLLPNPQRDTVNGGSGNDSAFIDLEIDVTSNVETVAQVEYAT